MFHGRIRQSDISYYHKSVNCTILALAHWPTGQLASVGDGLQVRPGSQGHIHLEPIASAMSDYLLLSST